MSNKRASLRTIEHSGGLVDRGIARLAQRQHGLVTTAQLNALGLGNAAISYRVACGRLHRIRRGVYAVGHPLLSTSATRLAAVLSCGEGTLASHAMGAAIWGVRPDSGRLRHVTTTGGARSRGDLRVHHASDLLLTDRAVRDGIPVTSLARTLADLGDIVPADHVRAAFIRAEQLRLLDIRAVDDVLGRVTSRRGPAVLREIVHTYDPRSQETRSRLELRLLDALSSTGLAAPSVDSWVDATYLVDFLWREDRIILETDGDRVHATATARRRDARRDQELRRRGYTVLRVPERELACDPQGVVATIRNVLLQRPAAA